MTSSLHYEAELVVAIGKGGFSIKVENAKKHIFGYAIGCDLTRRDLQAEAKKLKRPWATAKGFDYSAPIGAIVPVEARKEGEKELFSNSLLFPLLKEDSSIRLLVNGEIRQNSTIDKMIWSIPEIISYLSNYFRLKPGDLIMTGTPAGVDELNVGDDVESVLSQVKMDVCARLDDFKKHINESTVVEVCLEIALRSVVSCLTVLASLVEMTASCVVSNKPFAS